MDETSSLIRKQKRKAEIDFKLYFICQKNSKSKRILKAAITESKDKVLNNIRQPFKLKDVSVSQLVEQ